MVQWNDEFWILSFSSKIRFLLQLACTAVFAGRAWQHLYWDAPFRALLWDESMMRPLVQGILGIEWGTYVSNDTFIQQLIEGTGWFYVLCILAVWTLRFFPFFSRICLSLGGLSLLLLAVFYWMERFYAIGQFWEYTLQWSSPFFLLWLHRAEEISDRFILALKIAVVLTFTCHGLYALGYYPIPVVFQEMVMNILQLDEQNTILFLRMAGIMDFVLSVLLFLPGKWALAGAAYAVVWGFFTTIARVWAFVHAEYLFMTLHQWLHESIMRFPHFLLPLVLVLLIANRIGFRLKR